MDEDNKKRISVYLPQIISEIFFKVLEIEAKSKNKRKVKLNDLIITAILYYAKNKYKDCKELQELLEKYREI